MIQRYHLNSVVLPTYLVPPSKLLFLPLSCLSGFLFLQQVEAEVVLAAYEALAPAIRTIALAFSPFASDRMWQRQNEGKPLFDSLVSTFLQNINDLLAVKFLVRSRRAFLMNIKVIIFGQVSVF